jgi:hypothetical protein
MYAKFPTANGRRVRGRDQHVTIWIGPFATEAQQVLWRAEFESALEYREYKDYDIRALPCGKTYPKPEGADITPYTDAEEAVLDLPRIIGYKTSVSAL